MKIITLAIQLTMGSLACALTGPALAGLAAVPLGGVPLPILEGGLLTVAIVGLVAGIRLIRGKKDD